MTVFNVGSLNLDFVYQVDHFVQPGETLLAESREQFFGGKGFNQSVALARAGVPVVHAGRIGKDGEVFLDTCKSFGIDTRQILVGDEPTGHAIIQIDAAGENSILLFGGANQAITPDDVESFLTDAQANDILLLQNEVSSMPELIRGAKAKGMTVAFNPAPMNDAVLSYPLDLVDILILNETEAEGLSGESDPEAALRAMKKRTPNAEVILTLGSKGSAFLDNDTMTLIPARKATVVDTTAAGDTFVGYYLSGRLAGQSVGESIALANRAAAITVQTLGASNSIPEKNAVPNP